MGCKDAITRVGLASLVAASCTFAPGPTPPATAAETMNGTVVAIRQLAYSAGVSGPAIEIEVRSDGRFPVRNELVVLRVGAREFLLSRYPASGDLHTLIFTLTSQEFAQLVDGDPVIVQYGRGDQPVRWELGRFRRPAGFLDAAAPLYFDAIVQPGRRGATASVTLHTRPGVACVAVFLWPGAAEGGQRVPDAVADASGKAVLRWTVDSATPGGSWRIDATCGGRTVSTHVPIG